MCLFSTLSHSIITYELYTPVFPVLSLHFDVTSLAVVVNSDRQLMAFRITVETVTVDIWVSSTVTPEKITEERKPILGVGGTALWTVIPD